MLLLSHLGVKTTSCLDIMMLVAQTVKRFVLLMAIPIWGPLVQNGLPKQVDLLETEAAKHNQKLA